MQAVPTDVEPVWRSVYLGHQGRRPPPSFTNCSASCLRRKATMFLNAAKIDLKLTVQLCFKDDSHGHFHSILKDLENCSVIRRTGCSETLVDLLGGSFLGSLGPGMPSIIRPWSPGSWAFSPHSGVSHRKDLTWPSFQNEYFGRANRMGFGVRLF